MPTAPSAARLGPVAPAEAPLVLALADAAALPAEAAARVATEAAGLVRHLRGAARPGMLETFLAEYGLSTEEGVALMCLAEALLRVPDNATADALIRDKIAGADWSRHLGRSASPLVNASTWALMLTGRVLGEPGMDVTGAARRLLRRLGEPVVRTAVAQAMRLLGEQFVLGHDIEDAIAVAAPREAEGYTFSYDMLGEAARTAADAERYRRAYAAALDAVAAQARGNSVRTNPGLSVKLSALHPRYETAQRARVMDELVPRLLGLALVARQAGIGLNVDAEEQDRLELSLDVIEAVLRDPGLAGWDGFGVVVQAYGKRAPAVIDWLEETATTLDRRLMVRLVKGAYWDSEIKHAQTLGLAGFPVFTRKAHTDVSWLACAKRLLGARARLYPQFATHNAHSAASVVEMAGGDTEGYEFQRLHGMGEALHAELRRRHGTRCRIYAPVGVHRDLLAYLVRRLLENGANSSFVHRVLDPRVPVEAAVGDPVAEAREDGGTPHPRVALPAALYGAERRNSSGWNLNEPSEAEALERAMAPWRHASWTVGAAGSGTPLRNPADPRDVVGTVMEADAAAARAALDAAAAAAPGWAALPVAARADALFRAADLFEAQAPELMALAVREAGKTRADAVAELREAVDFLRHYAAEGVPGTPRGVAFCVSPWNFPLAIFTGQVAAALVTGNAVLAKPAEQTPLIAARAVALLHEAGVPRDALHLLAGDGPMLGAAVLADPRIGVVAFTGSMAAAKAIERGMAAHLAPGTPLIAETGGVNAMIVDSTALPEQVVRDALASGFQSAGQRCSALRLLCLQEDVAEPMLAMLRGAMRELAIGDPWAFSTDVGPMIDAEARERVAAHIRRHEAGGRVLEWLRAPAGGHFLGPALIRLDRVEDLPEEVFGPVVHVVTFDAAELPGLVVRINALGYGLTMGLHTRVEERVRSVVEHARVGNLYVNRNQIGAVVGAQPFGGEGLSGTGPKAGGPLYLRRFQRDARPVEGIDGVLPGPAGEANSLALHPRGRVLCLGPDIAAQARAAGALGNVAVVPAAEVAALRAALGPAMALAGWSDRGAALADPSLDAVLAGEDLDGLRDVAIALAARDGAIVPLLVGAPDPAMLVRERTLSVDTTSAGGNVALLAEAA
ncbi:bifunctional proline dehydrogenase/L-glutamate gamma-semialdehyde dehydrogenase PutA [Falsiroseomonas sp. HW251]|uniref:bifunctional proline dehydrogenase/L-glutamate gamma-semialdehyde dehydrogenase PutA n=1 Tax=Falsiroseomonas sp. HW251 TaxID=3390998 RepID=UPI003D311C33